MTSKSNGRRRPFTDRINDLRSSGMRYQDLVTHSGEARSSAWFNNLVNGYPWAVAPPPESTWQGFARLFKTDTQHVREMIAEEWFGVGSDDSVSERVRGVARALDDMTRDDFSLVEKLIHRLSPPDAGVSTSPK